MSPTVEIEFDKKSAVSEVLSLHGRDGKLEGRHVQEMSWNAVRGCYEYARKYEGDFPFMVDMRRRLEECLPLSDRQVAAIGNCLVSEIRKRQKDRMSMVQATLLEVEKVPPSPVEVVEPGYYTIDWGDGSHTTIRVQEPPTDWSCSPGTLIVGALTGPVNTSDYVSFGFLSKPGLRVWKKFEIGYDKWKKAVEILSHSTEDQIEEFGKAYSAESGTCYRCNRLLTDPESIQLGIGPVCRSK